MDGVGGLAEGGLRRGWGKGWREMEFYLLKVLLHEGYIVFVRLDGLVCLSEEFFVLGEFVVEGLVLFCYLIAFCKQILVHLFDCLSLLLLFTVQDMRSLALRTPLIFMHHKRRIRT